MARLVAKFIFAGRKDDRCAGRMILRGKLIIISVNFSYDKTLRSNDVATNNRRIAMKIAPFLVVVLAALCALTLFVANGRADVDPAMVGTWETRGVNANGPWKLIWDIRQDSSYSLSGAVSDSGIIGSGDGRWHTRSNVAKQTADGTYSMTDANHMLGTGPSGSGTWTRVVGKSEADGAGADADAEKSFSNPFEGVFGQATAVDLSKQLADDYDKALLRKDKLSRDRLKKNAQDGVSVSRSLG